MALDLIDRNENARKALRESEIRGQDALDLGSSTPHLAHSVWQAAWPKLAALGISLGLWQLVDRKSKRLNSSH